MKETGRPFSAGIRILAEVSVQFHEVYGYSLIIHNVDATYTLGEQQLKRQRILQQLEEDGVLSLNRELELPTPLQRIAIISAENAAGYEDFGSSALFAKDWDGAHMSSYIGSAYSTMAWQKDNKLAFMYEEETFAPSTKGGYTQVYKNYTIDQITKGAYEYVDDKDFSVANELRTEVLKARLAEMKKNVGENLGQYAPEVFNMVEKVANTYLANPSEKLYELFNLSVNEAPFNEVSDKKFYYLQNDGYKQAEKPNHFFL